MVKPVNSAEVSGDLIRRLEDLSLRCERTSLVTATPFLTPADQVSALQWTKQRCRCATVLTGGHPDCERKMLFFLPDWAEALPEEEYLAAIRLTAGFSTPTHRDYLGALLGMGVRREVVGDIWVSGQQATVFCAMSVADHLSALSQVGRETVRAERIPLSDVFSPVLSRKQLEFTVQSPRLDAVLSDVFRISRENAAKLIRLGAASLNYLPCMKPDAAVGAGDVLSLRGYGKAEITSVGGLSRKGRLYIHAEVYQ